jgi:hypothetical protein
MAWAFLGGVGRRWILQKGVFSFRICPLDLGEYMSPPKLLVGVRISMFAGGNHHQRPKSAISVAHSAGIVSFCPFAIASGPGHRLKAFSHWKPCLCYCWGPQKSSFGSVRHRALRDDPAESHLHVSRGSAHPHCYICTIAQTDGQRILFILLLTASQWWRRQACKKQFEHHTLYVQAIPKKWKQTWLMFFKAALQFWS